MEKLTGNAIRILLFLEKQATHSIIPKGVIANHINSTPEEYLIESKSLKDLKLINTTKTHDCIEAQGRIVLREILKEEISLFIKTMNKVDYKFALLELIKNRELIDRYEFPEDIVKLLPDEYKGEMLFGSLLSLLYSMNGYVDEVKNIYSISYAGKVHYQEIQEKLNESSSPLALNIGGDFTMGDSIKAYGNKSTAEIHKYNSSNSEKPKEKWYKKIFNSFLKSATEICIASFISFLSGLSIGKSCNPSKAQEKTQIVSPTNLRDTSIK